MATILDTDSYSVRKLLTGFCIAARTVFILIVNSAIAKAVNATNKNIHHWIVIRYGKLSNHLLITNHEIGMAILTAINTNRTKSFDINMEILCTLAPNTFSYTDFLHALLNDQ